MIQNFKPIEWGQYGSHQEEVNHRPDHANDAACYTPQPPWWCDEQAPSVNIDIYVPILIIIAVALALMKLQSFKLKTNGK